MAFVCIDYARAIGLEAHSSCIVMQDRFLSRPSLNNTEPMPFLNTPELIERERNKRRGDWLTLRAIHTRKKGERKEIYSNRRRCSATAATPATREYRQEEREGEKE